MKITIKCFQCGSCHLIEKKEFARQVRKGRLRFFCGLSCAASYKNLPYKVCSIEKTCPHCGRTFSSNTSTKGATFCSRSCASAGSMTEERRESQRKASLKAISQGKSNLISPAETLRKREFWKYESIRQFLTKKKENYFFEYEIGNYIYDLFLPSRNLLVEFDGPEHHLNAKTMKNDKEKDQAALSLGFQVIRLQVEPASVIPCAILRTVPL